MENRGINIEEKRKELEADIAFKKAEIARREKLATDHPELAKRSNDSGLPGPEYRIWQDIHALGMWKDVLAEIEAALAGLEVIYI